MAVEAPAKAIFHLVLKEEGELLISQQRKKRNSLSAHGREGQVAGKRKGPLLSAREGDNAVRKGGSRGPLWEYLDTRKGPWGGGGVMGGGPCRLGGSFE